MTKNITKNDKSKNRQKGKEITFADFDKLNLKAFAENLFQSMEKGTTSSIGELGAYTISLNAEFGNGKTTFLKMFKHFIKTEKPNYDVLSINAWESDFYQEPVIAILSELVNWMKEDKESNRKGNDEKKIIDKIIKILGSVANHKATKFVGNIANQTMQSYTGFNVKEITNSCSDKKNNSKDSNQDKEFIVGQSIFDNFNQRKQAVKEIKTTISEYTGSKKLLIIVDELDRARPDYAVHFLEDMKHFFNIENVVFLVAVNREQMETTVKCLYGENLKFDGYYRKFFKQEMDLPDPYKEAQKLVDDLIRKTKVKFFHEDNNGQLDSISRDTRVKNSYLSCKMFGLTLREIEYFIGIFEKNLGSKKQIIRWVYMDCYSFFICLSLKEKEIFNKILNGEFTVDLFFQFVDKKGFKYICDTRENIKIGYGNNYLLGTIACSLIKDQDSLLKNQGKIKKKFNAIGDVNNLFQDGFQLDYEQPVLKICETISQYKSALE